MGGWSQPLTSCVIRFPFINSLVQYRFYARDAATAAQPPRPITVILGGHPFAYSLGEEPERRALMPNDRGDTRSRQGPWVNDPAPGGGGQRVVGLQVRSACRHLAAYAESATRWIIRPRRLDPRADARSRRHPVPRCDPVAGLQSLWPQRADRMARHCGRRRSILRA